MTATPYTCRFRCARAGSFKPYVRANPPPPPLATIRPTWSVWKMWIARLQRVRYDSRPCPRSGLMTIRGCSGAGSKGGGEDSGPWADPWTFGGRWEAGVGVRDPGPCTYTYICIYIYIYISFCLNVLLYFLLQLRCLGAGAHSVFTGIHLQFCKLRDRWSAAGLLALTWVSHNPSALHRNTCLKQRRHYHAMASYWSALIPWERDFLKSVWYHILSLKPNI